MKNVLKTFAMLILLSANLCLAQSQMLLPSVLSGDSININLQEGFHQFYSGINTHTMGANGSILGPTVILKQGDLVNFAVENNLPDTTTIHWHGLHVAPSNDGGPHTYITPGSTWHPSFTILDKAATYWYHPHLHHKTDNHVSKGIAGMIIVQDNEEAALNLPRTYGVDDLPIVMQTKGFDNNKEILVHTNTDNVAMVNATIDAYYDVPAQVIRLRLLNGSSQRAFNVGLSDDISFHQIASDGGLLDKPVLLTRLLLSPGERAEILINLTEKQGNTIYLKSFASEIPNGIYGATSPGMMSQMTLTGYAPNPLNGTDFNLLKLNVKSPTSSAINTIPSTLVSNIRILENHADITRSLTLNPATMGINQLNGGFQINNTSFDMDVVNYTVPLNNTEIWSIINNSAIAHPFHIHDVQFYILDRNGSLPNSNELGRKDVVLIKPQETVRFIAKFENFADTAVPYMYHCHLLVHEDGGMMGQFVVKNFAGTSGIQNPSLENKVIAYPNPSEGKFTLEIPSVVNVENVSIYNIIGELVYVKNIRENNLTFDVQLPPGVYQIMIKTTSEVITSRIQINN